MGTRAVTKISGFNTVYIYRQMDGYPRGHGNDLYTFLKDHRLVNGFTQKQIDSGLYHNGLDDLFAYIVMKLKGMYPEHIGNIYLEEGDPSTADRGCDAEYLYCLGERKGKITLAVFSFNKNKFLYTGLIDDFGVWLDKHPKVWYTFDENTTDEQTKT
jgi:hypothetical protein